VEREEEESGEKDIEKSENERKKNRIENESEKNLEIVIHENL